MGFNAVFSSLKEIFPQVDSRVLKAVAIENANDLDAAVNDVLTEVLPFLTKRPEIPAKVQSPISQSTAGSSKIDVNKFPDDIEVEPEEQSEELFQKKVPKTDRSKGAKGLLVVGRRDGPVEPEEDTKEDDPFGLEQFLSMVKTSKKPLDKVGGGGKRKATAVSFPAAGSTDVGNSSNTDKIDSTTGASHEVSTLVDDTISSQNILASSDVDQATGHHEQKFVDTESKLESGGNVEDVLQQSSFKMASSSVHEKEGFHDSSVCLTSEWKDLDFSQTDDLADSLLEGESSIVKVDPPFPEYAPETVLSNEDDSFSDVADVKESITNSICNIDVLEESIEDAKHNKKTLFSAMESVITMMREVELEEKAVDQVTEEASRGGQDIMVKMEELKQMLACAKDANDMHAGEVYGEKAILATEVRELQCRLLSLSDERDKSLAILEEMRETLVARLAGVAELRKMAEAEKLEKEESARKALAEQEAIMEKVVEESKALQLAADENFKLREFLMDCGHVVDMLQGEISVICQDVKLLKEKFDERVPLSQSVSSSQTSCILASSGSSLKSVASDLRLERVGSVGSSESPKCFEMASPAVSPAASVGGLSPKHRLENETVKVDKQALMDDGWDVFDEDLLEYKTPI